MMNEGDKFLRVVFFDCEVGKDGGNNLGELVIANNNVTAHVSDEDRDLFLAALGLCKDVFANLEGIQRRKENFDA